MSDKDFLKEIRHLGTLDKKIVTDKVLTLQKENAKLRECVEFVYHDADDLIEAAQKARETLKELGGGVKSE